MYGEWRLFSENAALNERKSYNRTPQQPLNTSLAYQHWHVMYIGWSLDGHALNVF
jgi:hypothetical protein